MSMIDVMGLSLSFSGKELFNNIGFQVDPGDRIGLVGPNGSGKTSLLRLLTGEAHPDSGEIRISGGARFGYLPQDVQETLSGPLLQSILASIPGRISLIKKKEEIEHQLDNNPTKTEQGKMAERLAEIHGEINYIDSEYPPHKAEKILEGLGFSSSDFNASIASLSGGWKMRAALSSILYQNPDILLLDEPTNHLDLPSVRWLEQFLSEYKGAMVLVCHDKDFLNSQISRVVSFDPEGFRIYSGNYDQYMQQREIEKKNLEARARNQEIKVKEAKRFIERFRYKATKARQAQSKIKLLKKIEVVKSHQKQKSIRFRFPEVSSSGRVVINIKGLTKGFGQKTLYRGIDLTVMRGERVAIIGPNGSGKTTLLKILAGELDPDQGEVRLGHKVTMSYYAQHHSDVLNPENSIIEEVYSVVPNETISLVRGVCGAFLFSGDDVDKKIKVLSGGEKARVCLAEILIKPGNLLVMDEPTNHLDLISSEILIDALREFKGTLLFVSHNQSFINRLATKIWDISDGDITEYPGTLGDYFDHLERKQDIINGFLKDEPTQKMEQSEDNASRIKQNKKFKRKEKAEQRTLINSRLKPIKDRLSILETRIAELEIREKELGILLADPDIFKDKQKGLPLLDEYGKVKKELEESLADWEASQVWLEQVEQELGL